MTIATRLSCRDIVIVVVNRAKNETIRSGINSISIKNTVADKLRQLRSGEKLRSAPTNDVLGTDVFLLIKIRYLLLIRSLSVPPIDDKRDKKGEKWRKPGTATV